MKKKESDASILMWEQLQEVLHWAALAKEWAFWPGRRFKFDFAIITRMIAIEIEGGAWIQGRHTRGSGFIEDMEKYNQAALMGWRVFRFTPQQVLKGEAIEFIKKVLEA